MAKQNTRQLILNEGARLVHSRGFVNTGIQEILEAAGVPKGSFYFYFKSKEDFGQALVDTFGGIIRSIFDKHINNREIGPLDRLKGIIKDYCQLYTAINYTRGCPIGNLSLEMSDLSEPIRLKLHEAYSNMRSAIRNCLSEAQELDQIEKKWNVDDLAVFILNSWEGALLDMKLSKDIKPLLVFNDIISELLKSKTIT